MHRALSIVLLSVRLAGAERDSDAGLYRDVFEHTDQQLGNQSTQAGEGYICCVKSLDPDEQGGPRVTEIRTPANNAVKKCMLTAVPQKCQSNGQCTDECTKLIKDSLRWKVVRRNTQQLADKMTQSQAQALERQAQNLKAKTEKDAAVLQASALQRAQLAVAAATKPDEEKFELAQRTHKTITSNVEQLKKQLAALQKRLDAENAKVEPALKHMNERKVQLDKTTEKGAKDLEAAKKAAEETHKATVDQAAKQFKVNIERKNALLKKSADSLAVLNKEVQEQEKKSKAKIHQGMGVCKDPAGENFAAVDCCCSINHIPMRVFGLTFVNWEDCHGAFKYADTSMFGTAEDLFTPDASKCKTKICKNADGEAGACP